MASHQFYSTAEAANLLGLTARRVQQMVDEGILTRVARGLVDATSVDRYQASAQGGRTRVWAEHTAWGAIALLSGIHPHWLGATQASRLQRALRTMEPRAFVAQTRDRATTFVYRAHPAAVGRFARDLVITDSFSLGLVDGVGIGGVPFNGFSEKDAAGHTNGYFPASGLARAVEFYAFIEDPAGNLTVRATDFDIDVVRDLATASTPIVTAVDAATALDPREQGLGLLTLKVALDAYRR